MAALIQQFAKYCFPQLHLLITMSLIPCPEVTAWCKITELVTPLRAGNRVAFSSLDVSSHLVWENISCKLFYPTLNLPGTPHFPLSYPPYQVSKPEQGGGEG